MIRRWLELPWRWVIATWWISSTLVLAGGAWVFWIRLDGPQWRRGDWLEVAGFWAVVSVIALPLLARAGRRASRPVVLGPCAGCSEPARCGVRYGEHCPGWRGQS